MSVTVEIGTEAQGIIATMTGLPWFKEYDDDIEACEFDMSERIAVRREGDVVSVLCETDFGAVDFLDPCAYNLFLKVLQQAKDDAEKIKSAINAYSTSQISELKCNIKGHEHCISYMFAMLPGVRYYIVFELNAAFKKALIFEGDFLYGRGNLLFARVLDEDSETSEKAAEGLLKAFLLAKKNGETFLDSKAPPVC